MIVQAPANMTKSALLAHFERVTTIYIKQYGPGNLRLASNPYDLDTTVGLTLQDGIVQVTADGWKPYFWKGDLWWISDAAGAVVLQIPEYGFYINRSQRTPSGEVFVTDGELEGDLSTYPVR